MKRMSSRRMTLFVVGIAVVVAPSAALLAAPASHERSIIQVHTGRGKSSVRAGGTRQYRSYSVQPTPRTYSAPARPSTGRVISSAPMQAVPMQAAPMQARP